MDLRTKEAIRYLGYKKNTIDDKTLQLVQNSFEELDVIAEKRSVYQILDVNIKNDNQLEIGTLKMQSKHLCQNLSGCSQVILFATTLGTEVDRSLRKYEIVDLPRAVVLGACAAAYLEEYCDEVQSRIVNELKGKTHRPRFSPGYGDLSILYQEDILRLLDAHKKIGLSLTEAKMMTPSKSVTAFVGVCDTREQNDDTR